MDITKITELSEYEKEITSAKKVAIVFSAPWCGACHQLLSNIENTVIEDAELKVFNVDISEAEAIADANSVKALPTTILYQDGEAIDRVIRYKPFKNIIDIFK